MNRTPRVLVLRSGIVDDDRPSPRADVDVLVTHDIVAQPEGIAEARAFAPAGAALAISSRATIRVLRDAGAGDLFAAPFARVVAAGEGTARALEEAGARRVEASPRPGVAGIVEILLAHPGIRHVLWPRGSDASLPSSDALPGREIEAPIVYEKRPRPVPAEVHAAVAAERYAAVAVGSLAALDVFLASFEPAGPPPVRWGALGPETARAVVSRGLPEPVVPRRPRLDELITMLLEAGP